MKIDKRTSFKRLVQAAAALLAMPLLMGADGKGCASGGNIPVGTEMCGPADCDGLGAPGDAKLCPDGTAASRSVCATHADGSCFWDFPACPGPAPRDGGARSCVLADCNGMPVQDDGKVCPDGTTLGRSVCGTRADGTCFWDFPACSAPFPPEAGPRLCAPADCAGLGATGEAKVCPDGTGVGRSVCAARSDGTCFWDFPACPDRGGADAAPPACAPSDCYGQPILADLKICPDGQGLGRSCMRLSSGQCGYDFPACPGPNGPPGACTPADCAGQPVLTDLKLCANSPPVGRSSCVRFSSGQCGYDFPPCGPVAINGCAPVECAGLPADADAKICPDGTSRSRTECVRSAASAPCGWDFPACSAPLPPSRP